MMEVFTGQCYAGKFCQCFHNRKKETIDLLEKRQITGMILPVGH